MHSALYGFDLRLAQHKGMEFGQTMTNAIVVYDSAPAFSVGTIFRRNLDDTEPEIRYGRRNLNREKFLALY